MKKFLNEILYLIILLIIYNPTHSEKAVNYVIWLRYVNELPSGDREFNFNLINFKNEWEVDAFSIKNIINIDPYFILAKKVKNTSQEFIKYKDNTNPSEFEEQYIQYFITTELKSINGYYYILTDKNFCDKDSSGKFEDFNAQRCVTQFYITFYNNYKSARKAYETLFLNDAKIKILFGGGAGLIDSTSVDFFFKKYTQTWCPHVFGLYNTDFHTASEKLYEKWHVLLWKEGFDINKVSIPISSNDNVTPTDICEYDNLNTKSGLLAIPSEFASNCNIKVNSFKSNDYYRLYCATNVDAVSSDTDVVYPQYMYEGKCKDNVTGKSFLLVKNLITEGETVFSFECVCSNNTNFKEKLVFKKTYNDIYTQNSHAQVEKPTISDCDYSKEVTIDRLVIKVLDSTKKTACENNLKISCLECSVVSPKDVFIPKITISDNLSDNDVTFLYSNNPKIIMEIPLFNPNSLTDH